MKRRITCMILALTFVFTLLPAAPAAATGTGNTIYTRSDGGTTSTGGSGTEQDPYHSFNTAVEKAADGDTIVIMEGNAFANDFGSANTPLVIDKAVTIQGDGSMPYLNSRVGGFVLGADVTLKDFQFSYSGQTNAICANGHTLTVVNVPCYDGAKTVDYYAGALTGASAASGDHGKLILSGSNTNAGNVYAGSFGGTWSGSSTITLGSLGSLSSVSGRGSDGSGNSYDSTGTVTIELNDTNAKAIDASTSDSTGAAVVFSATSYANSSLSLSNVGTLTVRTGELIPQALNSGANLIINEGGTLDISTIAADTGSYTAADFTGGGTLCMDEEQCLIITGAASGETAFATTNYRPMDGSTSGTVNEDHVYIDASAATGSATFTFIPYSTQENISLVNNSGKWTATADGSGGDPGESGNEYVITYDANGGEVEWDQDYTDTSGRIVEFPRITRENHTFVGWFTSPDAEEGTEVTLETVFTADDTVYAVWSKDGEPSISFVPAERVSYSSAEDIKQIAAQCGAGFAYDAATGNAVFSFSKTPEEIAALSAENNWGSIALTLRVNAPDGYDTHVIIADGAAGSPSDSTFGGVPACEFSLPVFDGQSVAAIDKQVTIMWSSSTDSSLPPVYEQLGYSTVFAGRYWMDINWAPMPAGLLSLDPGAQELAALGFEAAVQDGLISARFAEGQLPTVEGVLSLMDSAVSLNAPDGAVSYRFSSSGCETGLGHDESTAAAHKSQLDASAAQPVSVPLTADICPMVRVSAGDTGMEYYRSNILENHVVLVQYYDAAGQLLPVEGGKDGYYVHIGTQPLRHAVGGSIVSSADGLGSPVEKPTIVLPGHDGSGSFNALLFPQQSGTGGAVKYYLQLESDGLTLPAGGVQIHLPFSMMEGLSEEQRGGRFRITHFADDTHTSAKTLTGSGTDHGISFTIDGMGPIVVEPIPLRRVVITGGSTMSAGGKLQLSYSYQPEDFDGGSVIWSVPEEYAEYASVSSGGLVTANRSIYESTDIVVYAKSSSEDVEPASHSITILPLAQELQLTIDGAPVAASGEKNPEYTLDMAEAASVTVGCIPSSEGADPAAAWKVSSTAMARLTVSDDESSAELELLKPGRFTLTATNRASGVSVVLPINVTFRGLGSSDRLRLVLPELPKYGLESGLGTPIELLTGTDGTEFTGEITYTVTPAGMGSAADGVFTAGESAGTARITAAIPGDPQKRTASVSVKVIPRQVQAIELELRDPSGVELTQEGILLDSAAIDDSLTFVLDARLSDRDGNPIAANERSVKYASSNTRVATVRANTAAKDGSVLVTVKKGASGVCTVTATSSDLAKAVGSITVFARDYSPRLESNRVTVNPYIQGGAALALATSYGNTVTDVQFIEQASGQKSSVINAVYSADDELVAFAAADPDPAMRSATIKGYLSVSTNRGGYELPLTVTVRAAAPSVTLRQTERLSLHYLDSTAEFSAVVKGADITAVSITGSEDIIAEYADGIVTVTYSDSFIARTRSNPGLRPNTKAVLSFELEGYALPVTKSVTVGTVNDAPRLTLSTASSKLHAGGSSRTAAFSILNSSTKEPLTGVEVSSAQDTAVMVALDGGAYCLELNPKAAGSYVVRVNAENWAAPISLTHRVSVDDRLPTAKLTPATVKIDRNFPAATAVSAIALSHGNMEIEECSIVSTASASLSGEVERGGVRLQYADGMLTASLDEDEPAKKGSYPFSVTITLADGTELRPVRITVSVTDALPRIRLGSSSVKFNLYGDYPGNEVARIPVTVSGAGYVIRGFSELDGADPAAYTMISAGVFARYEDGMLYVKVDDTAPAKGASIPLTPLIALSDTGAAAEGAAVTLRVQTHRNGSPYANVASRGKLDAIARESSGIVYTFRNFTGFARNDILSARLVGRDADMFLLKEVEDPAGRGAFCAELKLRPGVTYDLRARYEVAIEFTPADSAVAIPTRKLTVSVSESSVRTEVAPRTALPIYQSQSAARATRYTVSLTSPDSAVIGGLSVSGKTAAAVLDGLDIGIQDIGEAGARSCTVTLRLKDPGSFVAGRSYTVLLDVTPKDSCNSTRRNEVRLTFKVMP